jgi:hypothetical protein
MSFASAAVQADWGMTFEQLPSDICRLISTGPALDQAVADSSGNLWLVGDGTRAPIDSSRTLRDLGIEQSAVVRVNGDPLYTLARAPMVPPYYYTGTLVRGWGLSQAYLVDQGRLMATTGAVAEELGFDDRPMGVSVDAIQVSTHGSELPAPLIRCNGREYAGVDGRLVAFPWRVALEFGDPTDFVDVSSTFCGKLAKGGWMSQYVRDTSNVIWFVDDGARTRISAASVPTGQQVHVVGDAILALLPTR